VLLDSSEPRSANRRLSINSVLAENLTGIKGWEMSKTMLAVLALAVAMAMPAFAQSTSSQPTDQSSPSMSQPQDQNSQQATPQASPDASQPAQPQSDQGAASAMSGGDSQASQTMSGTISADGKTFNGNNTTYTISNPNSVKAYANQPISVGYEMDTNNSIRITKVFLTKPQQ
jgi:hypothetical protein